MNNEMLKDALPLGTLQDVLFHRVPREKAEHFDVPRLPNAMGPRLGLEVILRVPVTVKNNHSIRRGQVDAKSTCPSGEEESKIVRAGSIVVVHSTLPQVVGHRPIESLACKSSHAAVVLQDVQHPHHLRKNQHPVTRVTQTQKQLVQQNHFA